MNFLALIAQRRFRFCESISFFFFSLSLQSVLHRRIGAALFPPSLPACGYLSAALSVSTV